MKTEILEIAGKHAKKHQRGADQVQTYSTRTRTHGETSTADSDFSTKTRGHVARLRIVHERFSDRGPCKSEESPRAPHHRACAYVMQPVPDQLTLEHLGGKRETNHSKCCTVASSGLLDPNWGGENMLFGDLVNLFCTGRHLKRDATLHDPLKEQSSNFRVCH